MGTLHGLSYTEAALKALAKIEPTKIRGQIQDRISKLEGQPKPPGCAKVHGASNDLYEVYRLRQGKHRIVYRISCDSDILILDIGHRKDVYR